VTNHAIGEPASPGGLGGRSATGKPTDRGLHAYAT